MQTRKCLLIVLHSPQKKFGSNIFFSIFRQKSFVEVFFQTSLLEMSRVVWRQHQQQQNLTASTSTAPTSMMPPDDAPYSALNHPSGLSLSNWPLALVKLFLRQPIRATQ